MILPATFSFSTAWIRGTDGFWWMQQDSHYTIGMAIPFFGRRLKRAIRQIKYQVFICTGCAEILAKCCLGDDNWIRKSTQVHKEFQFTGLNSFDGIGYFQAPSFTERVSSAHRSDCRDSIVYRFGGAKDLILNAYGVQFSFKWILVNLKSFRIKEKSRRFGNANRWK